MISRQYLVLIFIFSLLVYQFKKAFAEEELYIRVNIKVPSMLIIKFMVMIHIF